MSTKLAKHCTACGQETVQQVPTGDDRPRDVCQACGEIHYINPKIVVGSVCHFNGKLLLCRRAIEPRRGYWTIPAGYMELGETAEEGAVREAYEEACARIRIDDLIAVYSLARISQVQLLFRSTLLDPEIAPGFESLEVKLFDWDGIPWSELAFPSVTWVLTLAGNIRHQSGPIIPAGVPVQGVPVQGVPVQGVPVQGVPAGENGL